MMRSTSYSTFLLLRRGQRRDLGDRTDHDPVAGEVVDGQDPQPVAPAGPRGEHHVAGERVDPLEPLGRVLGPQRQPGRRVVVGRRAAPGQRGEPELGRPVVGDHEQQLVRAVGVRTCSAWYSTRGAVRRRSARRRRRVVRRRGPRPHWCRGSRPDHDEAAAAGRAHDELELLVRPPWTRTSSATGVPSRCRQTWCWRYSVVVDDVEEGRRVGRPGAAVVRRGTTSSRSSPGRQVAEPQLVDLVAVAVDDHASTDASGEYRPRRRGRRSRSRPRARSRRAAAAPRLGPPS